MFIFLNSYEKSEGLKKFSFDLLKFLNSQNGPPMQPTFAVEPSIHHAKDDVVFNLMELALNCINASDLSMNRMPEPPIFRN